MLNFIGRGSAFNTQLGNNSAFIKEEESLVLIDCGGSVFSTLQELKLLDNVKNIYVLITHTHPDHVGSLGDLIFYSFYILKIKVKVFFPDKNVITSLLLSLGVSSNLYEFENIDNFIIEDHNIKNLRIEYHRTFHVETIPAYGFYLSYREKKLYYSGDSCELSKEVIEGLQSNSLDYLYQDISGIDYEGNRHLSINKLKEKIRKEYREKVYCMHFDKHVDYEDIKSSGFNIVEVYKK